MNEKNLKIGIPYSSIELAHYENFKRLYLFLKGIGKNCVGKNNSFLLRNLTLEYMYKSKPHPVYDKDQALEVYKVRMSQKFKPLDHSIIDFSNVKPTAFFSKIHVFR